MVKTASTMIGLGTPAPDFRLPDTTGKVVSHDDFRSAPALLVMFVCNHLVYRGQLDPSRPGSNVPVTGEDLRAALDAVLAGKPPSAERKPSLGCNIKWKPGNEPDHF